MDFQTTIIEIINSIKQRKFSNEAEVTNGIVLRILTKLGWDIHDIDRVKPQYRVANQPADFALCFPDNKPVIIIEVKRHGNAANADEQVLKYAFNTGGVPIVILTDGQEWHFYLPAERGSLTERRFYMLDLLEREPNEIEEILKGYLDFEAVKSGAAIKKAKSDYEKQYKNKEINASIPKAWQKLLQDKDRRLIELIAEKVAVICGFEPSDEDVINFLEKLKEQNETQIEGGRHTVRRVRVIVPERINDGFTGVKFNNEVIPANNAIRTLEELLKLAITRFPNSLNGIEARTTGHVRCLISNQRENLFNNPDLVNRFSKELPNGWWFGTNNSQNQIRQFCTQILACINQEYGHQNIQWNF